MTLDNIKPPLLSIVITSFNHAEYIVESINSMLSQSFQDFEIIVIDDASEDGSVEVVKGLSDSRIKLIALDKNKGVCNACNLGIRKARGKYIKLFASDDIALPCLLEKQVSSLENNKSYDAVFSGIEVINEEGELLREKTKRFEKFFPVNNRTRFELLGHFFFKGNCLAAPTVMIRTDCLRKLGGFDIRLSQAHDFDLWVRICLAGGDIYIFPEKLVQYRRSSRNRNMSSNTAIMRKRLMFDSEKILERYLSVDITDLVGIFPDLIEVRDKIDNSVVPFLIARQACKISQSHYHRQFSVNIIYNILSDSSVVMKLENDFEFLINKDFFTIVEDSPIGVMLERINSSLCEKFSKVIRKILNNFL